MTLSDDWSRLYVRDATFEKVEIFDRLKGTSLGTFTLTEGKSKTRIWGLRPDPQDKYLILTIKKYTLEADRWVIGPPTLVQYDLAEKKITRTIPWPKGEEREGVGVLFSPDGKLMYMFGEDILIYETATFTEVDRWEVSRPVEPGAGVVSIGGLNPMSDVPGFFTGFFTMQDPLQNRRIMGIGRIELAAKKIDFHPIGPSRGLGFAVSPDRKRGYGLLQTIEEYELWTFDLRELPRHGAHAVPRPAAHGPARQQQRQRALHPHRRQHDRSARRRELQAPADDHARRRHDRVHARAALPPHCGRTLRVSPWTDGRSATSSPIAAVSRPSSPSA